MSEHPDEEITKTASQDAFLDTGCFVEAVSNPRVPSQHLKSGSNYGNPGEYAKIGLYPGQDSPRPSPPLKLLCVKDKTRTTTDAVHPGWIRATSILLRGMERLRACEIGEAKDAN